MFFSGCLHGDEQVGPTAVVETAKLMVYAAMCQADPAAKVRKSRFRPYSVAVFASVVPLLVQLTWISEGKTVDARKDQLLCHSAIYKGRLQHRPNKVFMGRAARL